MMIRKLFLMMIVLSVGMVLVSPCVDADDAVHHRPHHQDVVSPQTSTPSVVVAADHERQRWNEDTSTPIAPGPAISALRC